MRRKRLASEYNIRRFGDVAPNVGLRNAVSIKEIEVSWQNSGKAQKLTKIKFDQTYHLFDQTYHLKETDAAPKLMPLKSFAFSKNKMNPEMKMD